MSEEVELRELVTIRDWLRHAVSRFTEAQLCFGHGSDNAFDEAAYLILASLALPLDRLEPFLDARLLPEERVRLQELLRRRVDERLPAAYLIGEAWLGEYRFRVDRRVIVPRSFIAELLDSELSPWLAPDRAIGRVLDLCTGSGCLAILAALSFPGAQVDAVDLSAEALEVARANVADYALEDRIRLMRSDLFESLSPGRYDLILSNPPYVSAESMATLPAEYRHEPGIALSGGLDGLDIVRRLLAEAGPRLEPGGLMCVEIGANRDAFERAFPDLAVTWVATASSDDQVFVVGREALLGFVR
ncbi:MAG: 50S ribosomal protein L3 glutamine methyltransferase [Rhodocyclaceae bacterium]|nr:50S ribosomal protein L3 glutamine methyltransferase [Rhodocyclaceae bacterium]